VGTGMHGAIHWRRATPVHESAASSPRVAADAQGPTRKLLRRLTPAVWADRRFAAGAVLGAFTAIGLGIALAKQSSFGTQRPALDQTAAAGQVRFAYPSGWRLGPAPSLTALSPTATIALAATAPKGRLIIGTMPSSRSSTLTGLLTATIPGPPRPELVNLDGRRFVRALDPRLARGADSQSLYFLTSNGLIVFGLCRTRSYAFATDCERVLGTAQVAVNEPAARTVNRRYAHDLNVVLARLNSARTAGAHQLTAAGDAAAQARAARGLSIAHAQAAAAVAALPATGADAANADLVKALRQLSVGYATLAEAAARHDVHSYTAGQATVRAASAAIAAALGELKSLGYTAP